MSMVRSGMGRRCDVCGRYVYRQRGVWVKGEFICITCHREILNGVSAGQVNLIKKGVR